MIALNKSVDIDGKSADEAAQAFLSETGLVKTELTGKASSRTAARGGWCRSCAAPDGRLSARVIPSGFHSRLQPYVAAASDCTPSRKSFSRRMIRSPWKTWKDASTQSRALPAASPGRIVSSSPDGAVTVEHGPQAAATPAFRAGRRRTRRSA